MNDDEEMRGYTPGSNVGSTTRSVQATWMAPPNLSPMMLLQTTGTNQWLCPDLLTIHQIGAADNLRGRVVRAFFRVLEWLPL